MRAVVLGPFCLGNLLSPPARRSATGCFRMPPPGLEQILGLLIFSRRSRRGLGASDWSARTCGVIIPQFNTGRSHCVVRSSPNGTFAETPLTGPEVSRRLQARGELFLHQSSGGSQLPAEPKQRRRHDDVEEEEEGRSLFKSLINWSARAEAGAGAGATGDRYGTISSG